MAVEIPVKALAALCDPFRNPWTGRPFTVADVEAERQRGRLHAEPFGEASKWTRRKHIQRIAHLVEFGWSDAVEVDVGVPALGCVVKWPLTDGNHRLAAALVRGDELISASVGGDINYAFTLFGVDVMEPGFERIEA